MVRLLPDEAIPASQRGWKLTTFPSRDVKLRVEGGSFPREFAGSQQSSLSAYLYAAETAQPRPGGIVVVEIDDDALEFFVTYAHEEITPNQILAYYQSLGL